MTAPRPPLPAEPADHPLRASLASGDRLFASSRVALPHLLRLSGQSLLCEAVMAQIAGMLVDLAMQLSALQDGGEPPDAIAERLLSHEPLSRHCHALALEWFLAGRLQDERALDPVLAPAIQALVAGGGEEEADLAIQALAAQARFAQSRRRMELPLRELPAELFHAALLAARGDDARAPGPGETQIRGDYEEGETRLALMGRLAAGPLAEAAGALTLENAGVALWASAIASRARQDRARVICAAVDPHLGRMLLTMRAAGLSAAEAERQAYLLYPDIPLPDGLHDIGTREAAQWLTEAYA